jgi:hypothetical protein
MGTCHMKVLGEREEDDLSVPVLGLMACSRDEG